MNKNRLSVDKEFGGISPEVYDQEARQYYQNAKELLKKSSVKYDRYQDKKSIQEACATCYLAVLKAIDGYLLSRGLTSPFVPPPMGEGRVGSDGYWNLLNKYLTRNGKIKNAFSTVSENLHILGYYRGGHRCRYD
ncbi:MAG: DUF5618 family protein [Candidatus Edwardsbacteria bacterium]